MPGETDDRLAAGRARVPDAVRGADCRAPDCRGAVGLRGVVTVRPRPVDVALLLPVPALVDPVLPDRDARVLVLPAMTVRLVGRHHQDHPQHQ